MPRTDPLSALDPLATLLRFRRGQEIYGVGSPTTCWYRVASGVARQTALFSDGRRQIVAFLMPGDFFGFSARPQHCLSAEAVAGDTVIARYPRRRAELLVSSNRALGERIREIAFEALSRMQARLLDIGRLSALERVGSFLLELADRPSAARAEVRLEMSRYDIADYLALSVETVSRSLTELRQRGTIAFADTRHVKIVDRRALQALAASATVEG